MRSITSTRLLTYGRITAEEVFPVLREHRRDQLGVVRLLVEVQLAVQMLLELVGERVQLEEPRGPGMLLGDRRRLAEQLEVESHLLDDPRPAHLDDDGAAALQERGVDLGDRGARQRLLVDRGEVLEPDVLGDRLAQRRKRQRLDVVDERAELLDVDVRQQVGPRGEQLTQLDERGAELLERLAEANRALARRRLVAERTNLAQHAQKVRAPRDRGQLERALDLALVSHRRAFCPRRLGWKQRRGSLHSGCCTTFDRPSCPASYLTHPFANTLPAPLGSARSVGRVRGP
jgi:hypothetical protein